MQQAPGPHPPGPDPGALALHSISDLGEVGTIATAQLIGGLSGLLVSEGLARVVREILGVSAPAAPGAAEASSPPEAHEPAQAAPAGEGEALAGLSAKALKELVAQGVAGRIIALNSLNTYLSLAAAEQLRRIGTQLATGEGLPPPGAGSGPKPAPPPPPAPAMTHPPTPPYPGPVYWSQIPPGHLPYRWPR